MKNSFLIGVSLGTIASVFMLESDAGKDLRRTINKKINRMF